MARKRYIQETADEPVFEMEPSIEGHGIFDYLSVWYGPPKIGKSTLLSKFEDAYFLMTEPGYKFLKIRKSKIRNWASFRKFISKAEKSPKFCKSVHMWVIDPVDKLAKFCMTYVCNKLKIDHPSDQEWGKGWEAFRDEFTEWMLRLCALGPGVAAISHVKERDVVHRGLTITKETPAMLKTCYTVLNDLADIIVYMGYEPRKKGKEQRRCLYTRGSESIEAGDRTGKLPDYIPFRTEAEAIQKIDEYFSGRKEASKQHSKKKKHRSKS